MPSSSLPELRIRPATTADAGEIMTLQRAAWVSEGRRHDTFDIPPLTQSLAEIVEDLRTGTAIVATFDGRPRIVGTVRARVLEATPTYVPSWYIGRLGVVPDLQGRGLGGELLAGIEARTPSGITRCVLNTGPKSVDNIAFYERHGYHRVAPDDPRVGPDFLIHLAKERP